MGKLTEVQTQTSFIRQFSNHYRTNRRKINGTNETIILGYKFKPRIHKLTITNDVQKVPHSSSDVFQVNTVQTSDPFQDYIKSNS